jgi:hypothetical protein
MWFFLYHFIQLFPQRILRLRGNIHLVLKNFFQFATGISFQPVDAFKIREQRYFMSQPEKAAGVSVFILVQQIFCSRVAYFGIQVGVG